MLYPFHAAALHNKPARPLPEKFPFPWGIIHGFLGPCESISRITPISDQPFLHGSQLWPTDLSCYSDYSRSPHLVHALTANNIPMVKDEWQKSHLPADGNMVPNLPSCSRWKNGAWFTDSSMCSCSYSSCTIHRAKRVKSFPSLTAHRAALISVPFALSQTPAYTAKTADMGPMHRAVCPCAPWRLGRYQIILLGDRGTWVWTACPELLPDSGAAGDQTHDLSIMNPTP